jgi:hypothetical protein
VIIFNTNNRSFFFFNDYIDNFSWINEQMPHKKPKTQTNQLVGAIDQGTSSSRFLVGFLFGRNKYNKNNYF